MTHREFAIHEDWLLHEWNKPSRSDYYLMKFMQVVIGALSKKGAKIPGFEELKVPFDVGSSPSSAPSFSRVLPREAVKHKTELARSRHLRGNIAPVTYLTRPKPLDPIQPSRK